MLVPYNKVQYAKARKANSYKAQRSSRAIVKPFLRRSIFVQKETGFGPELKNIETASTMVPPLTASFCTPQLINGCAQGVTQNERVGRKTVIKSVGLRYIYNTGTAGGAQSQVRIIVVYDKQANGASPLVGDVISGGQFYGFNSLGNADRFIILLDEISEAAQSSAMNVSGKKFMKCNLECMFGGATSGIASINSGSIYIMAANNSDPTIGSAAGTVYYTTRIRYTDA